MRESEQEGTFLSTVVLVGGTVYVAVAMAGIAVAAGIKTMSDDTYHIAAIFSVFFFTMLLWLLWVAVASVSLFRRSRTEGASAPGSAPAPAGS